MKSLFRKTLLIVFSFLILAACSNPFSSDGKPSIEEGTFTINIGGAGNSGAAGSRAAAYPPNIPDGNNPSGPSATDLKYKIIFTPANDTGEPTSFEFIGEEEKKGKVNQGTYIITMEVFLLNGDLYAEGFAINNPVTISGGRNTVTVYIYDLGIKVWVDTLGGPQNAGYTDLKAALDDIPAPGTYTVKIGANQSLAPYTFAPGSARDITLIANNPLAPVEVQLASNGQLFTVNAGITLTLGAGITLRGRNATADGADNTTELIWVDSGGTLVMKADAIITGNRNNSTGSTSAGTVRVTGTGSSFTMQGGEISGNRANIGGGVAVLGNTGSFTMRGGKISGNTASSNGGGVFVEGSFTMMGGEISGNRANIGGGVYVIAGSFTMQGGEISGNRGGDSALNGTGGVYVGSSGSFTMQGGEISRNTAVHSGGVEVRGIFSMEKGKISGNTARTSGGGVYVYEGNFTMWGGEISGNTATDGGGVYVEGRFTMRGGEISGNTASNRGGGVFVESDPFGSFNKGPSPSGVITGSDDPNGNVGGGRAVFVHVRVGLMDQFYIRNKTVGPTETLDSTVSGAGGGWMDP